MKGKNKKSKPIALGGILLAFSIITMFLVSITPTAQLSIYSLSSFYVGVLIYRTSVRNGWFFYFASTILAFILIPNKIAIIPYFLFFGLYGIIKYYIECLNRIVPEIVLKLITFNLLWGIGLYVFKELLFANIRIPEFSYLILVIGGQAIFLLYDYIYTLIIGYCKRNFRHI